VAVVAVADGDPGIGEIPGGDVAVVAVADGDPGNWTVGGAW
jgi:hypothetical protein